MKKLLVLLALGCGYVFHASADTFSIPKDGKLSLNWVQNAWNNRENEANQKQIADFLITKPKLPDNDFATAWQTARLVYFIGNYGVGEKRFVSSSEGVKLFDYGAKAGSIAIKLNKNAVEGYYWYAIDLGSYGLAKGILASAMHASDGMDALRKAMKIDPTYQWYGSSRILGRYYQELPMIFGGSSKKALNLLTKATNKAPDYDNNWVFLGQYYLSEDDYRNADLACTKAYDIPAVDGKYEDMRFKREASECMSKAKRHL
jgi:tetratricopeptide (TPR) repeat protein